MKSSSLRSAVTLCLFALLLAACSGGEPRPASLKISSEAEQLRCIGDTVALDATAYDGSGTIIPGAAFTWSSSDEGTATVDENGLVTAVRSGQATVTATAGDVEVDVSIDVAPVVDFSCDDALDGWTFTGDWGVYDEAPESCDHGVVVFPAQALGTNGNRVTDAEDPCEEEDEVSSAKSPAGVLPATLEFLSWNLDEVNGTEGDDLDQRTIVFHPADGGTPVTLLDCQASGMEDTPPCQAFEDGPRQADDWDEVAIETGAAAGQTGQLEFTYDTGDDCCGFEQGWFIRELNLRVL